MAINSRYSGISKFEKSSGPYRAELIADLYYRLNSWYKELPAHLRCEPSSSEGVLPPVIVMQYIQAYRELIAACYIIIR